VGDEVRTAVASSDTYVHIPSFSTYAARPKRAALGGSWMTLFVLLQQGALVFVRLPDDIFHEFPPFLD
jgi:hypothetical protein